MLLISIKVLEIFLQKCLVEKFPRELIGPNCNDVSVTCPRRVELCKHSADWHLRENVASIDQSAFLEIFLQGRLCRKISKISHRIEISSINVYDLSWHYLYIDIPQGYNMGIWGGPMYILLLPTLT